MIEALLFDLDGTLLDTLDDIHEVVRRVFSEEGLPSRTREAVRLSVGRGVEHLVEKLIYDADCPKERIPYIAGRIRNVYLDMGSVRTRPYPGILELLHQLDHRGFPMSVLTNKPQASADESVDRYFPGIEFAMIRGAAPDHPLKPSAAASRPVLEALGIQPPGRVAMVGDSDVDMDTALNAGMVPVGVSWGFRPADLLRAHGASVVLESPSEILGLLVDQGQEGGRDGSQ